MKSLAVGLVFVISLVSVRAMADTSKAAPAEESSPGSHFGIQAGLNFAGAGLTQVGSTNATGFTGGVVLESPFLLGFIFIQPELNFIQKGAANTSFGNVTLDYVELPILFKAKVNISGVKPFIEAGPKIAYLLSASSSQAGVSRSTFNSFDLGADFGGGVAYAISKSFDISLTVRYSAGVTDVVAGNWTNHGLQILAGLMF